MNDTTRRFLTAIVERVPADARIVELRLFPAIRQGGMESAVAVVAVELPDPQRASALLENEIDSAAHSESHDASSHDVAVSGRVGRDDAPVVLTLGNEIHDAYALVAASTGGTDVGLGAPDESVSDSPSSAPDADGADATAPDVTPRVHGVAPDASARPASSSSDYALAAHEIVDTDVTAEEEEGARDGESESTPPFGPLPLAAADDALDEAVGDALDEEWTTIVVKAEREAIAAQASDASHASQAPQAPDALAEPREDSPYADVPLPDASTHRDIPADGSVAVTDAPDSLPQDELSPRSPSEDSVQEERLPDTGETAAATAPIQRYAILTASYRLTLKGPDRGKWDVELTHEADAPLATVERVARGVAKRAGEESEPEHFSGESLQEVLDAPAWVTTT